MQTSLIGIVCCYYYSYFNVPVIIYNIKKGNLSRPYPNQKKIILMLVLRTQELFYTPLHKLTSKTVLSSLHPKKEFATGQAASPECFYKVYSHRRMKP